MNNKIQTIITATLMLFSVNSYAMDNNHNHNHKHEHQGIPSANNLLANIKLQSNELLIEVHGIVCSFCSKGVQNKLSKLDFVDTSKYIKGSLVDIDNQRVTLAIQSNKKADYAIIYESIKSGGYDPVAIYALGKNNQVVKVYK